MCFLFHILEKCKKILKKIHEKCTIAKFSLLIFVLLDNRSVEKMLSVCISLLFTGKNCYKCVNFGYIAVQCWNVNVSLEFEKLKLNVIVTFLLCTNAIELSWRGFFVTFRFQAFYLLTHHYSIWMSQAYHSQPTIIYNIWKNLQ